MIIDKDSPAGPPAKECALVDTESSLSVAKALADRSRLLILHVLRDKPLAVEEIAAALDLAPSTVSFHLKKLSAAGLTAGRRDQYYTVYSLVPGVLSLTLGQLVDTTPDGLAPPADREAGDRRRVLAAFFSEGRLLKMPAQKRKRSHVLEMFAALFHEGLAYDETEVNELITPVFGDYCLVRRLLVDEGYLTRAGHVYRRADKPCAEAAEPLPSPEPATEPRSLPISASEPATPPDGPRLERKSMHERKKLLRQQYKLEGRTPGLFRVRNLETGKVFLGSALDLNGPLNRIRFQLEHGSHRNAELQADYTRLGAQGFAFEIVDKVEPGGRSREELDRELQELEAAWGPTLDPENTYNAGERLRFP